MPRRRAHDRHAASAPPAGPDRLLDGPTLIDALMALHHPARRRLHETLTTGGAASVGQLAQRTGLAVGSVSHHLKALHRAGFVEPANELARDTRESWWRGRRRRMSWSVDAFPAGTAGRAVAELAEQANFEHQTRTAARWMRTRGELAEPWSSLGYSADNLVRATPEQLEQLAGRIGDVIIEWDAACRTDADNRPDETRMPVRCIARVFPSDPAAG